MTSTELDRQRAVLLDLRLRFAPEVQPVKELAIDGIIEQILFMAGIGSQLSVAEIQTQYAGIADGFSVTSTDITASLDRLVQKGQVLESGRGNRLRYDLADESRVRVASTRDQTDSCIAVVLNDLFGHAPGGPEFYRDAFLLSIYSVLSRVIEENIHWVLGEVLRGTYDQPSLPEAIGVASKFTAGIDRTTLEHGIVRFFREVSPDYTTLKWNLAQNYYVLRAIGMHEESRLLTSEIFNNAVFLIDTNVLVRILDDTSPEHQAFHGFVSACRASNIAIQVCRPHLSELINLVSAHLSQLEKGIDSVPAELLPKVESLLTDRYIELVDRGIERPDRNQILGHLKDPETALKQLFDIDVVDDIWFSDRGHNQDLEDFTSVLLNTAANRTNRKSSKRTWRRNPHPARQVKTRGAAKVDALVLLWVSNRIGAGERCWLVTLDRTLPGVVPRRSKANSLAIPFQALLLWVSPIAASDDISEAYMRLLSERLLPPERFLTFDDFHLLHELGVRAKTLPPEDVVKSIQYIHANATGLDLSNANDRERISHKLGRFVVDRERKMQEEMQRVQNESRLIREENARILTDSKKRETETAERIEELEKSWEKRLKQSQGELTDFIAATQREKLKQSAIIRLLIIMAVFVVLLLGTGWTAIHYGDGKNFFQDLQTAWPLFGGCVAITLGLGRLLLGPERLRLLGYGIAGVFKADKG